MFSLLSVNVKINTECCCTVWSLLV